MIRELEHLSYEEKLGEQWFLGLEKTRLWAGLYQKTTLTKRRNDASDSIHIRRLINFFIILYFSTLNYTILHYT